MMTNLKIDYQCIIQRIALLERCSCERCKKEAEKTKALIKAPKQPSDLEKNETT